MNIRTVEQASASQVAEAGGDAEAAKKRRLDGHVVVRETRGRIVLAAIDFATTGKELWNHPATARARGLKEGTLLDGGAIGTTKLETLLRSPEAKHLTGTRLIRFLCEGLLSACMEAKPELGTHREQARAQIAGERHKWPTGYISHVIIESQGNDVVITTTTVGDVYIALDSADRAIQVLSGSLQPRVYTGEIIAGQEKAIDVLKGDLKQYAIECCRSAMATQGMQDQYDPKTHDQFFYLLIYRGEVSPAHCPPGFQPETLAGITHGLLLHYATQEYTKLTPRLTEAQFEAMRKKGMNAWQQNFAQNNTEAGPCYYPALDACGTSEEGIIFHRLRIQNALVGTHPSLVIFTDGSEPTDPLNIRMDTLKPVGKGGQYAERTEMEITM